MFWRSLILVFATGCVAPGAVDPDPQPTPVPTDIPDAFELGDEVVCDAPHEGPDRFVDEAIPRGLDWDQDPDPGDFPDPVGDGLVATDLDGDGDVDLLLGDYPRFPRVLLNDGDGQFAEAGFERPALPNPETHHWAFWGAVDLDGDRLPEVFGYDGGWAAVVANLGGGRFGPPEFLYEDIVAPLPQFQTAAFGDFDGDADLDLLLPVVHVTGFGEGGDSSTGWDPHPDLLFRNDDGDFELIAELMPEDDPGFAQAAAFTDRDGDGDLDLFLPSEFGMNPDVPRSAFFRNDGVDALGRPALTNDAPELGADLPVGAMGIDSADINADGALDYCVSNVGPLMCLLSRAGGWVEGAGTLGIQRPLHPSGVAQPWLWSSYSLDFADFDADGWLELAVVGGAPSRAEDDRTHLDALWWGGPEGFEDVGRAVGWEDPRRHFGQGVADFDGDGFLDVVISGSEDEPVLWMNRCAAGGWLLLTFEGPGQNAEGHGVQVEVEWAGRRQVREVHNVRAIGQGPPQVHFGFGDVDAVDRVVVRWPDGTVQEATGVPTRRRAVVSHPSVD